MLPKNVTFPGLRKISTKNFLVKILQVILPDLVAKFAWFTGKKTLTKFRQKFFGENFTSYFAWFSGKICIIYWQKNSNKILTKIFWWKFYKLFFPRSRPLVLRESVSSSSRPLVLRESVSSSSRPLVLANSVTSCGRRLVLGAAARDL